MRRLAYYSLITKPQFVKENENLEYIHPSFMVVDCELVQGLGGRHGGRYARDSRKGEPVGLGSPPARMMGFIYPYGAKIRARFCLLTMFSSVQFVSSSFFRSESWKFQNASLISGVCIAYLLNAKLSSILVC